MTESRWVVPLRPNRTSAVRLLCVPFAGGGVASFRGWPDGFDAFDVAVVHLPGRETRLREPFCTSVHEAADRVAAVLAGDPDRDLVLFGHSMGALLAFEIARRLHAGGRAPLALVASGRRAPSLPDRRAPIGHLPPGEFARAVQERYGAIPAVVLRDPELSALLLPILQADIRASEAYEYRPGARLPCPILAYGGASDPHVNTFELQGWAEETSAVHAVRLFDGGHFYLEASRASVIAQVAADFAALGIAAPRRAVN